MHDPYPLKAWLSAAEVARLLGLSDTGLRNLRAADPSFPKPRRWMTGGIHFDKFLVQAWAERQPLAEEPPTGTQPEESPPEGAPRRRRASPAE